MKIAILTKHHKMVLRAISRETVQQQPVSRASKLQRIRSSEADVIKKYRLRKFCRISRFNATSWCYFILWLFQSAGESAQAQLTAAPFTEKNTSCFQ